MLFRVHKFQCACPNSVHNVARRARIYIDSIFIERIQNMYIRKDRFAEVQIIKKQTKLL